MKELGFKSLDGGPCSNSRWEFNNMIVEFDEDEGMTIKIYYLNYRWAFIKGHHGYIGALEKMKEHFIRQTIES